MNKQVLTLDEWQDIYNQLHELHENFIIKRNKNVNDFRYKKDFLENEKEKDSLVEKAVLLIRNHSELYDLLIEDSLALKDENGKPMFDPVALKEYYNGFQMYNHSHFYQYSSNLLWKIETKLNLLSEEE